MGDKLWYIAWAYLHEGGVEVYGPFESLQSFESFFKDKREPFREVLVQPTYEVPNFLRKPGEI